MGSPIIGWMHRRDQKNHLGDSLQVTFGSEQMETFFPRIKKIMKNAEQLKKD